MELWDLYDENRIPLGRTHPRGEPVPEGAYHLAVIVVILNFDIYALTWEGEPEDIRFQAGETDAAQWMPLAEWEAVAGTEGTLCPARGEAYKQELYRRIALYLRGQREFS